MPSAGPHARARFAACTGGPPPVPRRARRRHRRPPAASTGRRTSPCRSSLPLATQLSATPPARQRLRSPVSRAMASRELQHDLLGHRLDRRGEIHLALRERSLRLARRSAEQRVEARVGHREAGAVVEVVEVEPEGAVVLDVDQVLLDEIGVPRLAVRREPHHLVLARVHLEAGVVGERRIEQAERVGKVDLADDLEAVAAAERQRRGRPFADAVHRQHGRALERRREERARRVAQVMLGEQELRLPVHGGARCVFSSLTSRLF